MLAAVELSPSVGSGKYIFFFPILKVTKEQIKLAQKKENHKSSGREEFGV